MASKESEILMQKDISGAEEIATFGSCDKSSDRIVMPEGKTNRIPCLAVSLDH